jgi:hypothetical protein
LSRKCRRSQPELRFFTISRELRPQTEINLLYSIVLARNAKSMVRTPCGTGPTLIWQGWYGLTYDEYVKEANLDDAIVIECWKYMNEETSSGFSILEVEVKYI